MIRLHDGGMYLVNGTELVESTAEGAKILRERFGMEADEKAAAKGTIARGILESHNTSGSETDLKIRFDKLISHDITYVGIIQTARASGLKKFPLPYVLTNCHNSLCAVGGTINEDDHMFGLTAARKYGGVYVPPMQAVIHQYAREMLTRCGDMILGSDSHTRYGAYGTMAIGEGGPELVKQLLSRTYDIASPEVVGVYLTGAPRPGTGPQDVALALIGAVFSNGFVKNKVLEFVGPGVANLSADFRIGIDVMTTETTCLSSIWQTDETIREFYGIHGREEDYKEMKPAPLAYYDGMIEVDLSTVEPMIAMPYHPSYAYPIREVNADPERFLAEAEERAKTAFGDRVDVNLRGKIVNGKIFVDQGVIAGCAGGGYENICAAADILAGLDTGNGRFTLSVYPASTPIYKALLKNGAFETLTDAGAVIKPAFCGPCFGAGDTPANNAFSIRHSTRNFPNREGSKVQSGQIASVALMDARSIAATAANHGILTSAEEFADVLEKHDKTYAFDASIYQKRVYNGIGCARPDEPLQFGPNIKDWPAMPPLAENLLLKVVSEIHDPVTTTDELIPSGETSSLRSNPEALSGYALSRKDPAYVGKARAVRVVERAREALLAEAETNQKAKFAESNLVNMAEELAKDALTTKSAAQQSAKEIQDVLKAVRKHFPKTDLTNTGIGSTIFAEMPGDGSAREQAASCQKVLGGWANIARAYATKRYRSNLINWGMLPLLAEEGTLPFANGDYIYLPGILERMQRKPESEDGTIPVEAYVLRDGTAHPFRMTIAALTDDERKIIADGCLINYYKG